MNPVRILALLLISALFLLSESASAADCSPCGPEYCVDPDSEALIAAKKAAARANGLPERLLVMYDRIHPCQACISGCADWPKMIIYYDRDAYEEKYGTDPGRYREVEWTRTNELIARVQQREETVESVKIILGGSECRCCPLRRGKRIGWEPLDHTSELWNAQDQFWEGNAITIAAGSPLPDDLYEFPESYLSRGIKWPPFRAPAIIRPVQPRCPECQELADQYNALGTVLNGSHEKMRADWAALGEATIAYRVAQKLREEAKGTPRLSEAPDSIQKHNEAVAAAEAALKAAAPPMRAARQKWDTWRDQRAELARILTALKACDAGCVAALDEAREAAQTLGVGLKVVEEGISGAAAVYPVQQATLEATIGIARFKEYEDADATTLFGVGLGGLYWAPASALIRSQSSGRLPPLTLGIGLRGELHIGAVGTFRVLSVPLRVKTDIQDNLTGHVEIAFGRRTGLGFSQGTTGLGLGITWSL